MFFGSVEKPPRLSSFDLTVPDNLIAKGMPKEFIKQSNKELAAINIAYDKIKEIRGIS